ncbi:MAG: LacI family DNA-binding transcriptional regulator [Methylibium sp.]|uniref:LacI family DNA-binding transcriptional regulator n=1 Tax=Methylibium sp. TaxID=2067992 RepID=UPI0017F44CA2|nr:LacI family DNA-binding transcriptional regulator [Methylibium sp.]MBA3598388.1 LacI family DNA-binding transcriptional regulator [Methylibium sp.]
MQPKDQAQPNIEDVAAAAGVSTATVSRVLNKPASVREALRGRVIEAVTRLGYVPHAGARALKLQRSGTVGAIFPTIDNAIFAQAIDALQQRLADAQLQLLIATSGYDLDTEARQAMNLVTRGADALALCGVGQSPQLLQFLRQRELPTVHAMTYPPPPGMVCVGFDNARAIGQAVRYLLDLGHRRIAMLAGIVRDNDRAAARVAGVRQALENAGVGLAPQHLVERRYGLAEAREGFRALMAAVPAPTAIVCGNDVLAFGALLEAARMGIAVPAALSIVGFDDLEMARHIRPALTTLHVPTQQMWHAVADRLVAALGQLPVPAATEVEVELVVRESTGPVRQGESIALP